ncbi:MAG: hypothetical protein AB7U45_04750 [Desulfamplus sp.]
MAVDVVFQIDILERQSFMFPILEPPEVQHMLILKMGNSALIHSKFISLITIS